MYHDPTRFYELREKKAQLERSEPDENASRLDRSNWLHDYLEVVDEMEAERKLLQPSRH